eukprot:15445089-Alexandrium_andersonii.AAC.1
MTAHSIGAAGGAAWAKVTWPTPPCSLRAIGVAMTRPASEFPGCASSAMTPRKPLKPTTLASSNNR